MTLFLPWGPIAVRRRLCARLELRHSGAPLQLAEHLGQPEHVLRWNLIQHLISGAIHDSNQRPAGVAIHGKPQLAARAEGFLGVDGVNSLDDFAILRSLLDSRVLRAF